jgi:NAD(P)-dependent dehydrogenase (short-subunit alcohol dehydrogenase family)
VLARQRARVTGANSGIGKAVAKRLASDRSDYVTGTTLLVDDEMMLYPGFRTGG